MSIYRAFAVFLLLSSAVRAEVIVIANRTPAKVEFLVMHEAARAERFSIEGGEVLPIPVVGKPTLAYRENDQRITRKLDVNSVYVFEVSSDDRLVLDSIKLTAERRESLATGVTGGLLRSVGTIPVKILVDDDERAARKRWEERLRRRIENASDILEKHCRLRLKVVAVEEWNTDDEVNDFVRSLAEFERTVKPGPGVVAIGFTSQYEIPQGPTHLGGTRGPLHSHILIREWSQHITEAERMEVLIHEVGHFLGAAHSVSGNSVMRPNLGDRKARSAKFRIKFDPVNTLALNLVSEEIRARRVRSIAGFTTPTRLRLREIYAHLAKELPKDPAARNILGLMGRAELVRLAAGTRHVVRHVSRAARANAALPAKADASPGQTARRTGDALTEYYVQQAAWAAKELPGSSAGLYFLLGLGIVLDDNGIMLKNPQTRDFTRAVEPANDRTARLEVLGKPTMRGRRDLMKHFVTSAYLTIILGRSGTSAAGMAKELIDMKRNSGFSFADLAANQAGIQFAAGIGSGKFSLLHIASQFKVRHYLPSIEGLPEGLSFEDFAGEFGSQTDGRYRQVMEDIEGRIKKLPPYRKVTDGPSE